MALANSFNYVNKWEDPKEIEHFKKKLLEILDLEAPEVPRQVMIQQPIEENKAEE